MKTLIFTVILTLLFSECQSQASHERTVGGPCEGCEALLEYGEKELSPIDTLPGFLENEPKIHLHGIVYENDEKTLASDVIIYIYHTNKQGIYEKKGDEEGWGKRHGFIRGWIKTNQDGRYDFYTYRPASYPNTTIPQHIHMTVKEPDTNPYYIDDVLFTDDPLLTKSQINRRKKRGGTGVVTPNKAGGNVLDVRRDIILGKNIPDY